MNDKQFFWVGLLLCFLTTMANPVIGGLLLVFHISYFHQKVIIGGQVEDVPADDDNFDMGEKIGTLDEKPLYGTIINKTTKQTYEFIGVITGPRALIQKELESGKHKELIRLKNDAVYSLLERTNAATT